MAIQIGYARKVGSAAAVWLTQYPDGTAFTPVTVIENAPGTVANYNYSHLSHPDALGQGESYFGVLWPRIDATKVTLSNYRLAVRAGTLTDLNIDMDIGDFTTLFFSDMTQDAAGVSGRNANLWYTTRTLTSLRDSSDRSGTYYINDVALSWARATSAPGVLNPPAATGTIPNATRAVGGTAVTVNLATYFTGMSITYTAASSNTAVATVSVSGSTLTVTPGSTAGTATITATATNTGGTATQTFTLTTSVIPVPRAVGSIAAVTLDVGGASVRRALSSAFTPATGLTYTAVSSNTAVATVSVSGSTLTLAPGSTAGTATITITATNSIDQQATQTIAVTTRVPLTARGTIPNRTMEVSGQRINFDVAPFFSPRVADVRYTVHSSNTAVATASFPSYAPATLLVQPGSTAGSTTVTIFATSATAGSAQQAFTVTTGVASKPVAVGNVPVQKVVFGDTLTLDMAPYFSGGGLRIQPSNTIGAFERRISGTSVTFTRQSFTQPGRYVFAIFATNSLGQARQDVTIILVPAGITTPPTRVGTPPDLTLGVRSRTATIDFGAYFSGAGIIYDYRISNSRIATFDLQDHYVQGEANVVSRASGTATLFVNAYNAAGDVSQSFDVTVIARPRAVYRPRDYYGATGSTAQVLNLTPDVPAGVPGAPRADGYHYFRGDQITYSATSDDTAICAVSVSGANVTMTPGTVPGVATITLAAQNLAGRATDTYKFITTGSTLIGRPGRSRTLSDRRYLSGVSGVALGDLSQFFSGRINGVAVTTSNIVVADPFREDGEDAYKLTTPTEGRATLTVVAANPGGIATQTFDAIVGGVAPTANGFIPDQTLVGDPGATQRVATAPYFSGDSLRYAAQSTATEYVEASINASSGLLTLTARNEGFALVEVSATNSAGTARQSFVADIVRRAAVRPTGTIADRTADTNGDRQTLDVSNRFSNFPATYTAWSNNASVCAVTMAGSVLTMVPGAVGGTAEIRVQGENSKGAAQQAFDFTTTAPPPTGSGIAPVRLSEIPNQRTFARSVFADIPPTTVDVAPYFDGVGITFTATVAAPAVATATVDGSVVTITAVGGGTTNITITATNAGGAATDTFTFGVVNPPAPVPVGRIPQQRVEQGRPVMLSVAPFFSGQHLFYSARRPPHHTPVNFRIQADADTGILTLTYVADGSRPAEVLASNVGGTARQSFNVTTVGNLPPTTVGTIPNRFLQTPYDLRVGGLPYHRRQVAYELDLSPYFSDTDTLTYAARIASQDVPMDAEDALSARTEGATLALALPTAFPNTYTEDLDVAYTVNVTATDTASGSATQQFRVTPTTRGEARPAAATFPLFLGLGETRTLDLSEPAYTDARSHGVSYSIVGDVPTALRATLSGSRLTVTAHASVTQPTTGDPIQVLTLGFTDVQGNRHTAQMVPAVGNPPPVVSAAFPAVRLSQFAPPRRVDMSRYFSDTDALTFAVATSDSDVVSFARSATDDAILILTPGTVADRATITVRATDTADQHVTQTFDVTVVAPTADDFAAVGTVPDVRVATSDAVERQMGPYFTTTDGVRYQAQSSDVAVVAVTMAGQRLTLFPGADGTASVTVVATSRRGQTARQTLTFIRGAPPRVVDSTAAERYTAPLILTIDGVAYQEGKDFAFEGPLTLSFANYRQNVKIRLLVPETDDSRELQRFRTFSQALGTKPALLTFDGA